MLPFKRGAFHLAVQAQVRPSSPSTCPRWSGVGVHPGAAGWGTLGCFGVCSPQGQVLYRTQGGDRDLLKQVQQELESHLVMGFVWKSPLILHLLQVPIIPIVISPYWDFFSSKDKKFTSGKQWTRSPIARRAGDGDEARGAWRSLCGTSRCGEAAGGGGCWWVHLRASLAFPFSLQVRAPSESSPG